MHKNSFNENYTASVYRKRDKHGYPISFIYSHETKVMYLSLKEDKRNCLECFMFQKREISQFIEYKLGYYVMTH